ncbi:GumC family protein [Neptuniibacter sp. QD34_54]|uniref:GumC family protein n=1 Tax=Neptuniibacter sp. QD34_54 TaxID=3398208 RepID=UPI0039F4F8A8
MDNKQNAAFDRVMQDDVIDLREYWLTISRHKWGILGFAFLVTLLTILVVFSMKPVYRATATLLIEAQEAQVVSIEEVYGLESGNQEYFLTQFEILKSRKLAESVMRKLDLANHPEFNEEPAFSLNWRELLPFELPGAASEPSEEDIFQAKLNIFLEKVTISPVRKTQLVKVTYESYSPVMAAEVANAIGQAYIESNLEAKLEVTMQASTWLSDRLGYLRDELRTAEKKLQTYRDQEGIVGEKGGLDIASKELDLVSTKLVESRRDRLELQGVYDQIQKIGKRNPRKLELLPAVLQHPLVQTMKESVAEKQLKKSELAKRYGSKHPKMVAVNSELNIAYRSLNQQIISVVNGVENQYKAALASEKSLENSLATTKGSMQDLSRKEFKLRELQQDVDTKRALYDTFFTRFNETSATGDLRSANARIVDPAVKPQLPAKPKKGLIAALAFVVSIMFGVVFAFLLKALDNTVKTAADIESKLGETMMGLLPLLSARKGVKHPSYNEYLEETQSAFAESVRTIRTGVVLSALDNPHKVLAVTSTIPGEGKTSTAINMAYSLGQMERVLLIDADMRRPSLAKALGFDNKLPGLSNFVAGTSKLEDCIHHHEASGIDVLTAGIIPPNPLELLSSERFAKALSVLETKYDRIVIDTAPTQAVSDALVLAPKVGAMIYVVKADSTSYQQAKAGLKRLKDINAPLIGVVLNQVNTKKASKYYGADYGGYYDSYGYTEESKSAA